MAALKYEKKKKKCAPTQILADLIRCQHLTKAPFEMDASNVLPWQLDNFKLTCTVICTLLVVKAGLWGRQCGGAMMEVMLAERCTVPSSTFTPHPNSLTAPMPSDFVCSPTPVLEHLGPCIAMMAEADSTAASYKDEPQWSRFWKRLGAVCVRICLGGFQLQIIQWAYLSPFHPAFCAVIRGGQTLYVLYSLHTRDDEERNTVSSS